MSERRRVTVRVPEEDLEWLESHFPEQGSKTWFFSEALRRFREHMEVTPDDTIDEAVRSIRID